MASQMNGLVTYWVRVDFDMELSRQQGSGEPISFLGRTRHVISQVVSVEPLSVFQQWQSTDLAWAAVIKGTWTDVGFVDSYPIYFNYKSSIVEYRPDLPGTIDDPTSYIGDLRITTAYDDLHRRDHQVQWHDWAWFKFSVPANLITASVAGPRTIVEPDQGLTHAVYQIYLDKAPESRVTVSYRTADLTANGVTAAGKERDFIAQAGTIVFEPGQQTKTVAVPIVGDVNLEGTESFDFFLTGAVSNTGTEEARVSSNNRGVSTNIIEGDDLVAQKIMQETIDLFNTTLEQVQYGVELLRAADNLPESRAALNALDKRLSSVAIPVEIAKGLKDITQEHRATLDKIATIQDPADRNLTRKYADLLMEINIIDKVHEVFFLAGASIFIKAMKPGIELALVYLASAFGLSLTAATVAAVGAAILGGVVAYEIYHNFFRDQIRANYSEILQELEDLPPYPQIGPQGEQRSMPGAETIIAKGANSEVDYSLSQSSVKIDISVESGTGDDGKYIDYLKNFNNATGSYFSDSIIGNENRNILKGMAGDDVINGRAGNDVLNGAAGNDVLEGGEGHDTLDGGMGLDWASYQLDALPVAANLFAGFAVQRVGQPDFTVDTLIGIENVRGGSGDDFLIGSDISNILEGALGNDNLWGYGGDDTLIGGDGNDVAVGGDGNDIIESGLGQDWLYGQAGNDTLRGTDTVANTFNVLVGGDGNDTLIGGPSGFDYFYGGDGVTGGNNDTFVIAPNSGTKVVIDFEAGGVNDVLQLVGTPLTSFSQVQAAMSFSGAINGTVLVVDAGTQVWFLGQQPANLAAADFLFG
jgi:hypothetical protein